MNDFIKRQAEEFFSKANSTQIPEQLQAFAQDGVAKSRDAFEKISAAAQDQAKVAEDVLLTTQAGAKSLGTKLLENTVTNTQAAFDAAQALAKAKSLPEFGRLQAEFMQRQMQVASLQTKELFELSANITKEAFAQVNAVAAKSFSHMNK